MANTQLIILVVTIFGSQWASFLYLSNRIDRLADEVKGLGLKLDRIVETQHSYDKRIIEVERKTA
jgi:hypothetical protein